MTDVNALKKELEELQLLHTNLEVELLSLMRETVPDHVHIRHIKKQKLDLKDQIQVIRNQLLPDIIA